MKNLLATVLLLASLSAAVFGVGAAAGQESDQRFTLGILRTDGILLPFAAYDDGDWSTPWPQGIGRSEGGPSELPANLASVPRKWWGDEAPSEWRLWPRDSDAGLAITPASPVTIVVGRTRRLGLRTDYRAAIDRFVSPLELPFPKAGLAVGGKAIVQPIAGVSHLSPAWRTMPERLRPEIDEAEERAVRRLRSGARWTHPFDKAARAGIVPELEAWYTTMLGKPGVGVSYIEAVKKYPPQPEDKGCGLVSFVSGWIHQDTRKKELGTELDVVVTYCDREKASYMLPFGEMRLRDRTHWIFQKSGRDHEWYVVAELTPGRTRYVAEYYAGGVPSPTER